MHPVSRREFLTASALLGAGATIDASWRAGAKDPSSRGAHSTNSSYFSQDPFTALIRHLDSKLFPPTGTNWGYYADAEMDKLFAAIRTTFDPEGTEVRGAACS